MANNGRRRQNNRNGGNNNNGNNGSQSQSQRSRGNSDRKCYKCGKPGHKADDCRSSSNAGNKHCDNHPNSNTHTTDECGNNRNKNTSGSGSGSGEDRDGDIKMEGFAYANPANIPMAFSTKYCPGCNAVTHSLYECPQGTEAAARLVSSFETCWRCHLRGHTGDVCQNPAAKSCDKCRKSGHSTAACKSTSKVNEVAMALRSSNAAQRNRWPQQGVNPDISLNQGQYLRMKLDHDLQQASAQDWQINPQVLAEREAEVLAAEKINFSGANVITAAPVFTSFPTISPAAAFPATLRAISSTNTTTLPQFQPSNGNYTSNFTWTKFSGPTTAADREHARRFAALELRLEEESRSAYQKRVDHHCDRSKQLYSKRHANKMIRDMKPVLLSRGQADQKRLDEIIWSMGYTHFFRDPEAMQAIAERKKPVCRGCGDEGVIVDRWFRAVPWNQDVLEVEDFDDWGVFVVFENCKSGCCNYDPVKSADQPGYRFVPRPDVDCCEMDCDC